MIIGIDPGKSGGIAFLKPSQHNALAYPMPKTTKDIYDLLYGYDEIATVYLEKVHSSPQMGVASSFSFGKNLGILEGIVVSLGYPLVYVSPQTWQRELGLLQKGRSLGTGVIDKKNRNKALAQEIHPSIKVTHSIADALLIAEYGRRQERDRQ